MDGDGNGKIDKHEFVTFMSTQEGYSRVGDPHFFNRLDTDGNKTLDFAEVMTLLYIVKSGRPFCKRCSDFINDVYFTHDFYHHHKNGTSRFLDNYTLLRVKKNQDTNQLKSQPSTGVGSALGLDGVHRSRSLPSTAVGSALGSGSVTNVSYNTSVYNYGAYHPTPTSPNPSPSTANALVPCRIAGLDRKKPGSGCVGT
ncbi:hypothetical protein RJ640_001573 [Escallonia rubra]|uniref:EF-hand domain-containing protein n=1 Tax=Escallonia rubra TaxID=112253 RepID=A0AA88U368_9ASTE|nr:hypothetical protein RJ640_001573 [Escallonia rubra]